MNIVAQNIKKIFFKTTLDKYKIYDIIQTQQNKINEDDKMTTKKFIVKTATKIIMFAIISTIVLSLLTNPIITNELALGQMQNSNELYLLMETYNKVKPFISVIYGFITALFAGTTIRDTYKFIKTKTNKGEN